MLDKKNSKILDILNLICEDGVYKVVDYDTLVSHFPKKLKLSLEEVDDAIMYLMHSQYIDVKYSDDNTWCLCLLNKGKVIIEDGDKDSKILAKYRKFMLWTMLCSGVMSFLGATLAIIIFG